MYNACNKPVRLEFKRAGSDLMTSLNTSTFEEFPATDGDEIHILDDTGRTVVDRLTIAATMKEVHVASGCAKLEGK